MSDDEMPTDGYRGIFNKQLGDWFAKQSPDLLSNVRLPLPEDPLRYQRAIADNLTNQFEAQRQQIEDWEPDDSPQRTAEHTELMAQHMGELITLTHANMEITRQAQQASAQNARFSRGISWASLIISIASLGTAITVALVK